MRYSVKRISDKNQIETCEKFSINHYLWRNTMEPKAYGWAGYVEGKGMFIKMVCEEANPTRERLQHRERVCDDSAMEFFFAFTEDGEELTNNSMYINFEMNANAAMYTKFGKGRKNRQFISPEQVELTECKATVEEDYWSVEFFAADELMKDFCDWEAVKNGKPFYFNFYKISETAEIEHYGSYTMIDSETPNFHLPVCFAEAVIE